MFFSIQRGRRKLWFALFFLCATLLGLSEGAVAFADTISVEFGYCQVDGFVEDENAGVGYELMTAALERLSDQGYKLNVTFVPAMRLLNGYRTKRYDMIFPIMKLKNFTLESFQKWGFDHIPLYSLPLYDGGQFVIYTHTDHERLHDLESLSNKSIAVIAGAYIPVDLVPPTTYEVERVQTGLQGFKMVQTGRVDAFLVHKEWGKSILADLEMEDLHHGQGFEDIRGGFIAQDNALGKELIGKIDQIIADMIEDGTYGEILKKYPGSKQVVRPE